MVPSPRLGVAALRMLTCDDGRDAPAHHVVEAHGPRVDVAHLGQHAVDVQALHEGPGEGAHVDIVQEDGGHRAQELRGRQRLSAARDPARWAAGQALGTRLGRWREWGWGEGQTAGGREGLGGLAVGPQGGAKSSVLQTRGPAGLRKESSSVVSPD